MTALASPPLWLSSWHFVTRLGEAQILLPAAALVMLLLWHAGAGRVMVRRWLMGLAAGVLLTTASKVAFIGFGLGWARLNFTGISGHAMFAASVLPAMSAGLAWLWARAGVGVGVGAKPVTPRLSSASYGMGAALALLVGVSRVMVNAHSLSEVVAGLALGYAVSAWAARALGQSFQQNWPLSLASKGQIAIITEANRVPQRLSRPVALLYRGAAPLIMAWFALAPAHAPDSNTHHWVKQLSLALSGRAVPFTRHDLLRGLNLERVP